MVILLQHGGCIFSHYHRLPLTTVCSMTLLNEIFLRYGLPRRVICDNGRQFVSDVMQHLYHQLYIKQPLIHVDHPQANTFDRKKRYLKFRHFSRE